MRSLVAAPLNWLASVSSPPSNPVTRDSGAGNPCQRNIARDLRLLMLMMPSRACPQRHVADAMAKPGEVLRERAAL